jgi:hypothetical protein
MGFGEENPMLTKQDLFTEIERLPLEEKWQLVRHLLHSLEREQTASASELSWHEFLRATYGSLADTPIERPPQLPFEDRAPFD